MTTGKLFTPATLGNLSLANRTVMAPMTRTFSPKNVPNDLVVEYYRRRAAGGVGLIVTEGTYVNHIAASGYDNVPTFYGEEALAGWKKVVDAVHAEGGKICMQILHSGRYGYHPFAVSASAVKAPISPFKPKALSARGVRNTISELWLGLSQIKLLDFRLISLETSLQNRPLH